MSAMELDGLFKDIEIPLQPDIFELKIIWGIANAKVQTCISHDVKFRDGKGVVINHNSLSRLRPRWDYYRAIRRTCEDRIKEIQEEEKEQNEKLDEISPIINEPKFVRYVDNPNNEVSEENERVFLALEAEKQRDHEIQMALIQKQSAEMQLEASRLAAEAAKGAQEQTSNSLDKLIVGLSGDNQGET